MKKAFELYQQKRFDEVLAFLSDGDNRKNLTKSERHQLYNLKGKTLHDLGRLDEAVPAYQAAIKADPVQALAYFNLGVALKDLGKLEAAIAAYQKALKRGPAEARVYLNLASACKRLGKIAEAERYYRKMLRLKPDDTRAYRNLAYCIRYTDPGHLDIAAIEAILEKATLAQSELMNCHFALGKIHADLESHAKAFEHFRIANNYRQQQRAYNIASRENFIKTTGELFSKDFVRHMNRWGSASQVPVMVFGLPRSGKTLLETLMMKHSAISGVGEISLINEWASTMSQRLDSSERYPTCLRELTEEQVQVFAREYLARIERDAAKGTQRIISTMPAHDFHLGFIHLLFPRAKVIHCTRNPMDLGLSVYFKYFASGNLYSSEFENIAHYYSRHLQIMDHWRAVLPIDVLTVSYEDLLENPARECARVLQYLELDAEAAVMAEATASVSGKELYYWKNWQHQLQPLQQSFERYGVRV